MASIALPTVCWFCFKPARKAKVSESKEFMSAQEFCAELLISRKTFKRLCDEHRINFVRVRGRIKFRRSAVAQFIARNEFIARP
ncbi:MAG: helix-turn-helix domain-containing protein [Candidatus Dormibacteria bacterium]